MKLFRYFCLCLIVFSISWMAFSEHSSGAEQREKSRVFAADYRENSFTNTGGNSTIDYHSAAAVETVKPVIVKRPTDGGIRENVSDKFQLKYQKWKAELLATEFGRQQWEQYAANKNFILTVTVSDREKQGAGTGKYEWDAAGLLVGATITLGGKIDRGYPNPIYFPVMNSLALDTSPTVSGEILAAAKFAHEFGHVNLTARTNGEIFQRQNNLMPAYNSILLENGYNTRDQRLIDLVGQMGGTPVKIWEDREYWGETNAMNFLIERLDKENYYCAVLKHLRDNINLYAKDYEKRFNEVADASPAPAECRK